MRLIIVPFLILTFTSFAQVDSVQRVNEVVVSYAMRKPRMVQPRHTSISIKVIEEMAPEDAGELIRKFAGVSLKSYGGLGGLKTVSMRGLGANHTAVVSDGFSLSNAQTGQINLGQIQAENITNIVSIVGASGSFYQPISAQISGSLFLLETFENSFSRDTLQIRSSVRYGSFQQKNGYFGVKYTPNRFFISVSGAYRDAEGNYPYTFQNGVHQLNLERTNNDYKDWYYGVSAGFKGKKTVARLGYKRKQFYQGLPGAVILYNQTQDERLTTKEDLAFGDFSLNYDRLQLRIYGNGSLNAMNYIDPTYFNSVGKIDVTYDNRSLTAGISVRADLHKYLEVFGGMEEVLSDLKTNDSTFAQPVRFHNFGLLGLRFRKGRFGAEVHASSQYVDEQNRHGNSAHNRFRVSPFTSGTVRFMRDMAAVEGWYRNSFRMPNFNELYYNNIGNNQLEPEDAHQFNLGIRTMPVVKNMNFQLRVNGFYNRVQHKIVAIPTQNLFVWSMQNIGEVEIYGGEAIFSAQKRIGKDWSIVTDLNYTFQHTVDITDSESPTYQHQVAYIPLHSANGDVSIHYKQTGIRISSNFVSERYALNENNAANRIEGFYTIDASIFHKMKVAQKNRIQLQLTMKNVTNNSYAYIRSFVMPGINYLISLSYAFN